MTVKKRIVAVGVWGMAILILLSACRLNNSTEGKMSASIPSIKSAQILDENSQPLPSTDGWFTL